MDEFFFDLVFGDEAAFDALGLGGLRVRGTFGAGGCCIGSFCSRIWKGRAGSLWPRRPF